MKQMQGVIVGVALGMAAAALAQTVQRQLDMRVNGQAVQAKALLVNNQTYVPLSVLGSLGVSGSVQNNVVLLSRASAADPPAAGTTQLAGQQANVGTSYTVGRANPLNFNLTAAEYRLEPITLRDVYSAQADQKLLVLRFAVQNPTPRDLPVGYAAFKITAVDDKDVNYEFDGYVAREGEFAEYDAALKPSQRVNLVAAWPVGANANIVKLLVERKGEDAPILRYDLRGKVKPLTSPFSLDGIAALAEVKAQTGIYYPLQRLAAKVESFAFTSEALDGRPPAEGRRYLTITTSVRNLSANQDIPISYRNFTVVLTDADGATQENPNYTVRASGGDRFESNLRPGAEARFRFYFEVGQDQALSQFGLREGEGRNFVFDLSQFR